MLRDRPTACCDGTGVTEVSDFSSFRLFAVVSAFTPGPNNITLAASAATFGFRATWPHILVITVGFNLLFVAGFLGLNELFSTFPLVCSIARYAAFCFLLYLCWKTRASYAYLILLWQGYFSLR